MIANDVVWVYGVSAGRGGGNGASRFLIYFSNWDGWEFNKPLFDVSLWVVNKELVMLGSLK